MVVEVVCVVDASALLCDAGNGLAPLALAPGATLGTVPVFAGSKVTA